LTARLTTSGGGVSIVVGRGGIGKSRLLRSVSTEIGHSNTTSVRFLATSISVEPAQFELLPRAKHLVVFIDDAHDRTDIAAIIEGIRRCRPNAWILLSLRPQGLGRLAADFRQAGLHQSEIPTLELKDLPVTEAEALAKEILGQEANPAVVRRLATVAPDCPLLIVVGATLIKRGQLDPRSLESDDKIRTEILTRFRDVVVTDATVADPELRESTLRCVAILQPIRIEDQEFRSALSALTKKPFDQVMSHLKSLESFGVLLRRGASFRIVPDLLGDVILAEAAMDLPSGISTGYVENACEKVTGKALLHIFTNTSRVDWQIRKEEGGGTFVVDSVWDRLVTEFKSADIRGRLTLLNLLEKIAFFQPGRALNLVRWAIDNPVTEAEEAPHPLFGAHAPHYRDVLRELPKVLEDIGNNLNHLPTAADTLWELAHRDGRPTNQYPYHPIRILSALAAYGVAKPIEFQNIMIDKVKRWLLREDLSEWSYSPFEILKPLLETEVEVRRSDGLSITLQGLPVKVTVVTDIRARVLDLAFAEAHSKDPRRAVAAVKTIQESIRYPSGKFGRPVAEEERDHWTPLFAETINRLGQLGAERDLDPAVYVIIDRTLEWHAKHSPTDTRVAARTALSQVFDSVDRRLAQVLHDSWIAAIDYSGDTDGFIARHQAHLDDVVAVVTSHWPDEEVVDNITRRLAANRLAYGDNSGTPGPFIWTLVRSNPAIGEIICHRVVNDPTCNLRELVSIALSTLAEVNPSNVLELANELIASDDVTVQRQVAHAFGWGSVGRATLIDGEADFLRSLIRNGDTVVRQVAIASTRRLSTDHRSLALELITTIDATDSGDIVEEIAGIFNSDLLPWTDLSSDQVVKFLSQLRTCPRISGYQTVALLSTASKTHPREVLELLKGRVEAYEQGGPSADYEALPHNWETRSQFRETADFSDLLQSIIWWIAKRPDSWYRKHEGAEIFAITVGDFDDQVLEMLIEIIETGKWEQIRAIGAILTKVPVSLVWENVEFVTRTFRAADRHGEQCIKVIGNGFHAAVSTGVRWGAPGEPFPEDVLQRDKSIEIAARLPQGSVEQHFYQSLRVSAENNIRWEGERDRDFDDGRSW
jgi:hypothetical protein